MKIINNIFCKKQNTNYNHSDIKELKIEKNISDIYIIGNGPSLTKFNPKEFNSKFTIGTNRSWLWGKTDLLVWRDNRITEEIEFFEVEKPESSLWIS